MKKKDNPWQLNKEEQQILKDYEDGKFVPVADQENKIKEAREAARNTLRMLKNKQINIRVSGENLSKFKKKASESGMKYQTVISLLMRKYVEDEIKITI